MATLKSEFKKSYVCMFVCLESNNGLQIIALRTSAGNKIFVSGRFDSDLNCSENTNMLVFADTKEIRFVLKLW